MIRTAMMLPLIVAATAAPGYARGCADHWQVELDRDSFAHNGADRTFKPAELAAFRTRIQSALRTAAADACKGKELPPSDATAIRRVRIHSASGASEPTFYSPFTGTLNFEWVFAEEGLAIPARADMVGGLICWAKPDEKMCADLGD
jgi:hypothetical protein